MGGERGFGPPSGVARGLLAQGGMRHHPTFSRVLLLAVLVVGCTAGSTDSESDTPDRPDASVPAGGSASRPVLRRLTAHRWTRTVEDVLGVDAVDLALPTDGSAGPFTSNAGSSLTRLHVEQYGSAAAAVASRVALPTLDPCIDDAPGRDCAEALVRDVGRRLFRRPVSDDDLGRLLGVFDAAAGTFPDRARAVVAAMLQSPRFLYHVEAGVPVVGDPDRRRLDGYEVASRLAFFLWDAPPDEALFAAAAARRLDDAAGVREEARRLLESPRAMSGIGRFHLEWLHLEGLGRLAKDTARYPIVDDELREAMRWETLSFVEQVFRRGDGRAETLLSAPFSFLRGPLFRVYGLTRPLDHDETRPIGLDPAQRAGILTQPAVMATHAHADVTSPVHRGLLVLEEVLCRPIPSPPADASIVPVRPTPGDPRTRRERFAEHVENPACATCHDAIDPLGFAFEHLDALGAYRTEDIDDDAPVDASGEVRLGSDIDGPVVDAVDLVLRLAASADVRRCLVQQWFQFALGRPPADTDRSTLEALTLSFEDSDGHLPSLLVDITASDPFRFIQTPGATDR